MLVFMFVNPLRSYNNKTTDFHDKEVPKVSSNCACSVVIILDFVLGNERKYIV